MSLYTYRIVGFFRGGKFSRISLIQLFEGENFHESRQEHTVPNAFSKYFEGKIFTNGYRFVKFVKIFPLEKNPLYGIYKMSGWFFHALTLIMSSYV